MSANSDTILELLRETDAVLSKRGIEVNADAFWSAGELTDFLWNLAVEAEDASARVDRNGERSNRKSGGVIDPKRN